MHCTQNNIGLMEATRKIDCPLAYQCFQKLYKHYDYPFLLESKTISHIYGRLSLIGVDPVIRLFGKDDQFTVEILNERGKFFLSQLHKFDFDFCDIITADTERVEGTVIRQKTSFEETERSKQKNISRVIRLFLQRFQISQKSLLGLYGAFSYDFVRQFESLPEVLPENDVPDFNLFLYDTFIFFDHLKAKSEMIVFRNDESECEKAMGSLLTDLDREIDQPHYAIHDAGFTLTRNEYEEMVETAREYCRQGELFEVVFSNILRARFKGDPFALYLKYRETNPSPYLFYFDFGNEQLAGASPEMMARCEDGRVTSRPISGTAKRGRDPLEDHDHMLDLLKSEKERAELDMLIDLGRNDLSRVRKPGIEISDYRFVEKYSAVMHTVAQLSGELAEGYSAFDAFIASLNAGTLTGAPKVAAMEMIERHEKERRGYYGGAVGYLSFSGDMDTGIIIRTAHIKNGALRFQVGATLLYDSIPEKEYQETLAKAEAFLNTFSSSL